MPRFEFRFRLCMFSSLLSVCVFSRVLVGCIAFAGITLSYTTTLSVPSPGSLGAGQCM